jgi:hypothetical protein
VNTHSQKSFIESGTQGMFAVIQCRVCVFWFSPQNTEIKIYTTIIFSVVFFGFETWSLTVKEVHTLRVFENRVLRNMFGPKRDEATGQLRRLHNEKLYDMHSTPNIIWAIK